MANVRDLMQYWFDKETEYEIGKYYVEFSTGGYPIYTKVISIEPVEERNCIKYTIDRCHMVSGYMYDVKVYKNMILYCSLPMTGVEIPEDIFNHTMDAFDKILKAKNVFLTVVSNLKKDIKWTQIGFPKEKD